MGRGLTGRHQRDPHLDVARPRPGQEEFEIFPISRRAPHQEVIGIGLDGDEFGNQALDIHPAIRPSRFGVVGAKNAAQMTGSRRLRTGLTGAGGAATGERQEEEDA